MLLIQQSSSFRVWTSRALMVYFRRALLFLVVSPRQYINNKNCLLQQQQQQKVYFSDAEDDEEKLMINDKSKFAESLFDQSESHSNRMHISQSNGHLLKQYASKKFSQGLNNSMGKSIQNDTINSRSIESINKLQPSVTESDSNQDSNSSSINAIKTTKTNENKVSDDFVYQYQANSSCLSRQQTSIKYQNQTDTLPPYSPYFNHTIPMLSYPSCPSCLPLSSIGHSFDDETLSSKSESLTHYSSTSSQQNLPQSSDDEDDIYEKQSMLVFEPNTSVITVRPLTYHPLKINNSIITSHICVRLIAHQTDLSIQCDTKPIGCKTPLSNNTIKSISINNKQQKNTNLKNSSLTFTNQLSSDKKLHATSILIDIPYRTLYIDS